MINHDERIAPGGDVLGADGEKIGTVAYVVVHPPEMHVTDYVVSTGFLGRDIIVPVDRVKKVEGGKVATDLDKDALQKLPDYVEVHYEVPPADWAPAGSLIYPSQSVLWPAGAYYPDPASVKVNAPEGTVGLHEGMTVESSDGHKVGSIKALDEDPASGDVTDMIVKEGLLFSHDVRIPCSMVAEIHADRVTLNLAKVEVESRAERVS
jgi:sporulation protein YlmC with PRC-barrel domain